MTTAQTGACPRGARLDHAGKPMIDAAGFLPELDAIGEVYAAVLRAQIRHDPGDVVFRADAVPQAVEWATDTLTHRLEGVLTDIAKREIMAARAIAAQAVTATEAAS